MKLFLLDAYALIYRAYYAFIKAPRINSKGINTSAIFGFVNTLEEILKKEKPDYIGVAFDPSGPTFRHEMYDRYKAQREETPEAIRISAPFIKEIIAAYRIPILEVAGFEADDVIGTLARKIPPGIDVFMMTPDKDYAQLVAKNIFMYRPKYGSNDYDILGVEEVLEKYGLSAPEQMIDYLGLIGDKSDNIPGCPGVGDVTARKLLKQFGTIENLLSNTVQLQGSLKTKIEENKDMILFSKFLATIKTDVPIEPNLEDLKRANIDEPALRKIFDELEFRNLAARVFGDAAKKTIPLQATAQYPVQGSLFGGDEMSNVETTGASVGEKERLLDIPHTYKLLSDEAEILRLTDKIKGNGFVSFDTETTGIDPLTAELVGMSFALREGEAYFVPVSANRDEAMKTTSFFREILEDSDILKIGQNLKFDVNVMKKYGIRVSGRLFDTLIAHYLLNPETRHNLDYLAETYLNYENIHIEELIGAKGKNQLNMRQLSPEKILDYAAEDADVALRLKNIFEKKIVEQNLYGLFYDIEIPLMQVLADMEEAGVRLDTDALKQSSDSLNDYLRVIENEVYESVGMEFNINSPKIVGEILFEKLKIVEKAHKTKSGQYSTSEDVLEGLKSRHPAVGKILEYRKIKKLLSTYVDALPELISTIDNKVHTTYNQAVTSTGRLSSTNPNLQNIPIRDEEGKEIRKAFIPDDGCLFFSADYSQIELRIMAHLSGDRNMIDAFSEGKDIHAATAAKIFGVPLAEVTKEMRRKAKTANFGIIYGISVFGLAERLNIPRAEAKELIEGYFTTYPDVKAYMDKTIAIAREKGYVETIFGRRRFLPDINSRNAIVRGYAERNAINAPIQGSAADIIKVAMNDIYRQFKEKSLRSRMIMQVHDELNFNVFPEELEIVGKIVVESMGNAAQLSVPLIADCGAGKNWLEAH